MSVEPKIPAGWPVVRLGYPAFVEIAPWEVISERDFGDTLRYRFEQALVLSVDGLLPTLTFPC